MSEEPDSEELLILRELAGSDKRALLQLTELLRSKRDEQDILIEKLDRGDIRPREYAELLNESTARWIESVAGIVGRERTEEVFGVPVGSRLTLVEPDRMESESHIDVRQAESVDRPDLPKVRGLGERPHYMLIAVEESLKDIESLTGELATSTGVNEYDLVALVRRNPEILCELTGSHAVSYLKKEVTFADRSRADFSVHFYGGHGLDIVEAKSPKLSLLTEAGELSQPARAAIKQLTYYARNVQRTRQQGQTMYVDSSIAPRKILIGMHRRPGDTKEQIARALAIEGYEDEYVRGTLIIATIEDLAFAAKRAIAGQRPLSPSSEWTADEVRQLATTLGRRALAQSLSNEVAAGAGDWRGVRFRLSGSPSRQLVDGAAAGLTIPILDAAREYATETARRMEELLPNTHDEFDAVRKMNWARVHGALLLSNIIDYSSSGDMPIGKWEHSSTAPAVALLKTLPLKYLEAVAAGVDRIINADESEDSICAATQIARWIPSDVRLAASLGPNGRWTGLWNLDNILKRSERGIQIVLQHLAYLQAMTGDSSAIAIMVDAATRKDIIDDASAWNWSHSNRAPEALLESLRLKAVEPLPALKPIARWHQALHDGLRDMIAERSV